MRLLRDNSANIFCRNKNGSNALHISVKKGLRQVVLELIKMEFPLDKLKDNGLSALAICASKGNLELMKDLMDGGADVN